LLSSLNLGLAKGSAYSTLGPPGLVLLPPPGLGVSLCEMSLPSSDFCRQVRRSLLIWFQRARRDLPWRRDRDPYRICVSEVMLQQTQVAPVIPYFERFQQAFPTLADLAAADEQEVLRLWEGLGYYRRARDLHRAARQVVAEHGGQVPADPEALRSLP